MWRCVSWCQEFRCIHLLRPLVNPSFTFARNEGATNFTAVATKNTCTFILSFVVFISILNCVSKIAIRILIVNRSFNFICPFFPGVFDACICKSNGRKSSPFPGPYIQTCIGFMSVVKTFNSTANECECHPCAGCHAMHEWFQQFFGLLLADVRLESNQHSFTAPARFLSHPKVFATVCKTGIMVTRSWPVFRRMKKNIFFANSSLVLFDFLSSLCIEKTYCFTNMPFLWASG